MSQRPAHSARTTRVASGRVASGRVPRPRMPARGRISTRRARRGCQTATSRAPAPTVAEPLGSERIAAPSSWSIPVVRARRDETNTVFLRLVPASQPLSTYIPVHGAREFYVTEGRWIVAVPVLTRTTVRPAATTAQPRRAPQQLRRAA